MGWKVGAAGKGFRTLGCSETQAGAGSSVPALTGSQAQNSCLPAAPRRCLAERGQQFLRDRTQAPSQGDFSTALSISLSSWEPHFSPFSRSKT